jgi:precorrin-2 dehydrogenase / sirohydrochlorin ferrochelatase
MFIDLKEKRCVVIGGGSVAYRKIKALLEFEAEVTVVSTAFCDKVRTLSNITRECKSYEIADIEKADIVIAATNNISLNKSIASDCNNRKIPVNVVDMQEDCSFIFPAYIKKGAITVGVTSSGKSPVISQTIKKSIEEIVPDYMEELVILLGEIREEVKASFSTEEERKRVYKKIVEIGCIKQGKLTKEEVNLILTKMHK